jgi:hypothetical protein
VDEEQLGPPQRLRLESTHLAQFTYRPRTAAPHPWRE